MGYDVDRFVEAVNEGLLCSICRDVLEEPLQAPCEHVFCSACISAWLVAEPSCPEDRHPLTSDQLRPLFQYMRNDLARLKIRCQNYSKGCDHVSSLEFSPAHEDVCPLEEVTCVHGCGTRGARAAMSQHMEGCEGVGRGRGGEEEEGERQCSNGCGQDYVTDLDREHNCIAELRTAIEILRSEMVCKLQDQRQEMEVRLDMQRAHMVQRETALKGHIEELKTELARVSQTVKLLMEREQQRRQDLDRMQEERLELLELLNTIQRDQEHSRPRCHHCSPRGPPPPPSAGTGGKGKVTTL
ncbi:hypothetical protein ACOMHN_041140 [Nucella lapillus]